MRPLLSALCLIAGVSAAQAQQSSPDSIAATLSEDWNAYQIAQKHVIASLSAVANELNKARADLAAVTKERDELKTKSAKQEEAIKAASALAVKANAEIETLKAERDKLKADGDKKP